MKQILLSYLMIALFLLTGCQQQDFVTNPTATITKTHTISMDSALTNLKEFMDEFDDNKTRFNSPRSVNSIEAIILHTKDSRASGIDCDTILYIANFNDQRGYAILSADNRIPEPILVITDTGNMLPSDFYASISVNSNERPFFSGYPAVGPDFFSIPETGDEIYINPNTVNLYTGEIDKSLVGNFNEEHDTCSKIIKRVSPAQLRTESNNTANSLIFNYAISQIKTPNNNLTTSIIDNGEHTGGYIAPILAKYADWYQDEYLNRYYPERYDFTNRKKRRAPAGCFPLAIAKIMMHYKLPTNSIVDNYRIDWDAMSCSHFTGNGAISAAHLLYGVSQGCDSWYFATGTFTFPWKAKNYMKNIGFKDAELKAYSFENAYELLTHGKPFIIFSIPTSGIVDSHSWIIDGYCKVLKYNKPNYVTQTMVHCDFGQKNQAHNGYYHTGIFKFSHKDNIYDNPQETEKHTCDTYYKHFIYIISY